MKRLIACFVALDTLFIAALLAFGMAADGHRALITIVFAQAVSIPVIIVAYAAWLIQQESKAVAQFADAHGFQVNRVAYEDADDSDVLWNELKHLDLFAIRSGKVFGLVLTRSDGPNRIATFNFLHMADRKPIRRTITSVAMQCPSLSLPNFSLHPRNSRDAMISAETNRHTDDSTCATHCLSIDRSAQDTFWSEPLSQLLSEHPELFVEGNGNTFAVYLTGGQAYAKQLPDLMAVALKFFAALDTVSAPRDESVLTG